MRARLLAHAVVVGVILALAATARAGDETCEPTPETIWHPAGVEGCTLDGPTEGIASTWGGDTAAANWCSWTLRHSVGCGTWTVQSLTTGVTITVEPGQFCHCYWMTDRRLIDLTRGQVAALGLDAADGLFEVTVTPIEQPEQGEMLGASLAAGSMTPAPVSLPDTAAVREINSGEQANGYNRDAFSRYGIAPSERNRIHSDSPPASAAIPAWRRGRSVHRGIDR